MTWDDFSCLFGFQIFRGRTPDPPLRLENLWFIFQSNTAQHRPLSFFKLGSKQQELFSIALW